jgi:hypothetical protein
MNPDRCNEQVYNSSIWHSYQCSRKIWKDGKCKQHHPDTVRERAKKSDENYRKKIEALPSVKYKKALEAEQAKVKKLEGWLKFLWNTPVWDDSDIPEQIREYIKAMED